MSSPTDSNTTVCEPVKTEVGEEPLISTDGRFGDIFNELAKGLVDGIYVPDQNVEGPLGEYIGNGKRAQEAMKKLGCVTCSLSGCLVRAALDEVVSSGDKARYEQTILNKIRAFTELKKLLGGQIFAAYDVEIKKARELIEAGVVDESLPHLVWGVDIKAQSAVAKKDIEQLKEFTTIDGPDLPRYIVSTDDGRQYEVIDTVKESNEPGKAPPKALKILFNKFIERIIAKDENGKPHIETADGTAQKIIKSMPPNGTLYEIRMAGKNRFYFILSHTEGQPMRLIILGSHGGDGITQRVFLQPFGA